ncbi:TIGR03086 family metal-binding protein [Nocardia sp. NPDC004068]|uniref:TIGR03086 family metal-binding protein n=1 Tax=Nocardia sp. NPDC004068 TaxID=3364303 RepID=UPI0036B43DDC
MIRYPAAMLTSVGRNVEGGYALSSGDMHDDWLGADHRVAFAATAELDRAAWHQPATASVRLGFGTLPVAAAALVHLTEILVHATDLALVTGQDGRVDDAQCAALLTDMRATDFDAFRRPGMFGHERPCPADDPAHRRLLAFVRRDLTA